MLKIIYSRNSKTLFKISFISIPKSKNIGAIADHMDKKLMKQFLLESKMEAYAGNGTYRLEKVSGINTFARAKGRFSYSDTFVGFIYFAGQEIVQENGKIIWSSVYSGGLAQEADDPYEIYNFLRLCLREPDSTLPVRGKEYLSNGQFSYKNMVEGDIDHFMGYESIETEEDIIYELHYSGGSIIN